jgi:hypothetical protein
MSVPYYFCYYVLTSHTFWIGVVLPQLSWKSGVFPCFSVEGLLLVSRSFYMAGISSLHTSDLAPSGVDLIFFCGLPRATRF